MNPLEFLLQIGEKRGRSYPVAVLASPSGETPQEAERFPFDEATLEDRLTRLQVELLRSGMDRSQASSREQMVQDLGRSLFNAVFRGTIRTVFARSRSEATHQGKVLRITLRILSAKVAALPWEFLYDPDQMEYLCLSPTVSLVRYIPRPQPALPLPVTPPLRILGMTTSPKDLDSISVEREKRLVEEALAPLKRRGYVELVWLEGGTAQDLQRAMRRGPWHVFHFVGHGGFDAEKREGFLVLEDRQGRSARLYASDAGILLSDTNLRLVVLNSCRGAGNEVQRLFASTASLLAGEGWGIPTVLAMQFSITNAAALVLAHEFYRALVDNVPVDAALYEARKAMKVAIKDSLEWGTPVLYMRSSDGHLFAIHHAHSASHASSVSGIPLPVGQEHQQAAIVPSADLEREKQAQDLADRLAYLRTVDTLYSRVPLLLDPAKSLSLQSIFQPLELLQNPLAAEEVFQEDRHAWLGPAQPQNAEQGQPLQHQPPLYVTTVDNSEEALKKSPQGRMVIVANPGAGKTTLLRYMVAERARQAMEDPSMPVPIFISLPDLADMNMQVETYLASTQERMLQSPEYARTLRNAMTQGQAFVCLDGLDEVAAHKRAEMVTWINLWASHPGNTWIVSSRLADYKERQFAEGQFVEWGLQPMDHQLRSHLAQQLLPQLQKHIRTPHSSIDPTAFVDALEKHPRAATWGENPLLFGLAALVFVRVGRLPSARSILYKEATNVIIEAHEPEVWKQVELRLAAAVLAKRLYSAQQYTFKARELFVVVQKMYKEQAITREPTEMAARILTSGILEEIRPQTYRFHHQTLLEYLTAVEIAQGLLSSDQGQREEMQRFVSGVSAEDDWREVLRLMVGILVHRDEYEGEQHEREGAQAAIRWLSLVLQRREAQADQQDRGLMLALHSLSEIAHTESHYWMFYGGRDLEKKAALAWAGRMLKRWWADHSWDALADEVRLLDATAVKVTCDTLLSEKERFIQAVDALGMIGNSGDGELLKRLRMVYEEHWVAYAKREGTDFVNRGMTALIIALALVRLGQHQYVQWLLEVTRAAPYLDMNGSIRTAIAQALGKSHAADAVQLLVKILRDRNARIEYGRTRMGIAAAQALEQAVEYTPPEILLPVLLDALSDLTPEVHTAAAHVLGRLWRRISGRELASAIRSHFQEERKAAEQLLLASEGKIPAARVSAMLTSSNPSVRVVGLHLLDRVEEPVMAIAWQTLLKDRDVRKAAIERGARQREQVPIERLIATLYDQDWEVRAAAVAALITRKEEVPIDQLAPLLKHGDGGIRRGAVEVLAQSEQPASVSMLEAALTDNDVSIREEAIKGLGYVGRDTSITALRKVLTEDEDEDVRVAAIDALVRLDTEGAIDLCRKLLQDDTDAPIRVSAVRNLGVLVKGLRHAGEQLLSRSEQDACERRVQELISYMLDALRDEDEDVRLAAVEALGALKDRAYVKTLITILEDRPDPLSLSDPFQEVRAMAARRLGELGDRVAVEPLIHALQDNTLVYESALLALGKLGDRAAIEPLVALLRKPPHPDLALDMWREKRRLAAQALGWLNDSTVVGPLLDALGDPYAPVREAAAHGLAAYAQSFPVEQWIIDLHEKERDAWLTTVIRIGMLAQYHVSVPALQDKLPVEALILALGEKSALARTAAAYVLALTGSKMAKEPLCAALGDSNRDVRKAALVGLQAIAPEVLQMIIPQACAILLGEEVESALDSITQGFIAEVIADMGVCSPTLLDVLTQMLYWPYWEVRMKAAQALGKLQHEIPDVTVHRLFALCEDLESRAVRQVANEALGKILQ